MNIKTASSQAELLNAMFYQFSKNKRFHHATLITGEKGIGKNTFISNFISKILQSNSMYQGSHSLFQHQVHPDIFTLKDTDSNISTDDARNMINFLSLKPSLLPFKFVVIDSIDSMNINGYNTILKSVEEPIGSAYLFFVCHNINKIPITILSRCNIIKLPRISEQDFIEIINQESELGYQTELAQITNNNAGLYLAFESIELDKIYLDFISSLTKENDNFCENFLNLKLNNQDFSNALRLILSRFYWICIATFSEITETHYIAKEKALIIEFLNKYCVSLKQILYAKSKTENAYQSFQEYNLDKTHLLHTIVNIAKLKDSPNIIYQEPYNRNPLVLNNH